MTYIDKLFDDFGFCAAMTCAMDYCRQHCIKYKWVSKEGHIAFSWLDPDDDEIHVKIS